MSQFSLVLLQVWLSLYFILLNAWFPVANSTLPSLLKVLNLFRIVSICPFTSSVAQLKWPFQDYHRLSKVCRNLCLPFNSSACIPASSLCQHLPI